MAKHEVGLTLPNLPIVNTDAEFEIQRDGEKLGTLKVSRGTVEWVPRNHHYGYHLDWAAFDDLMRSKGIKGPR